MDAPSKGMPLPPNHRKQSVRQPSTRGRVELPKESQLPQSIGNLHIRMLKQLDAMDKKAAAVAPSLASDQAYLRQLVEQLHRACNQQLTRTNIELQHTRRKSSAADSIMGLLSPLAKVLGKIANDSIDEKFQQLYDEFVLLLQKVDRKKNESIAKPPERQKGQSLSKNLINELKSQQGRRRKVEEDIDSVLEGTRQSLLIKEARIKELQKLMLTKKYELGVAVQQNDKMTKVIQQQAARITVLEQQLKQVHEASMTPIEQTSTTMTESRIGKMAKSPILISSPKNSEFGTDNVLSPPNRGRSRPPPMPSPASLAEDKKRQTADYHQEGFLQMLLTQAHCLESILHSASTAQ